MIWVALVGLLVLMLIELSIIAISGHLTRIANALEAQNATLYPPAVVPLPPDGQ